MNVYLLQAGVEAARLEEIEQKLKPSLPDLVQIPSFEAIGQRSNAALGARVYAILVAPSTEPEFFAKLVATIGRYRGNVFFILVSGEINATNYKQLVNRGNADWASEAGLPNDVLEIIGRIDGKPPTPAAALDQPTVLTFLPSAGGVGNTTLAMETGVQLAKRKGAKDAKTCLIDLDFQASLVCDYLDIEPRLKIDEIIDAPDRLDSALLDVFVTQHSSGLAVFAAPRRPFQDRNLSVEALSALFDLLAQRYNQIVIDMPLARHSWTIPVLTVSHAILVTGRNTIPGLRQMAESLKAIDQHPEITAPVRVVVNDCEVNLFGRLARTDHVGRVLERDVRPFFVRHSSGAVESVNAGAPMTITEPSSKTVKDIRAIAKFAAELRPAREAAAR